jgi:hypothetical protein
MEEQKVDLILLQASVSGDSQVAKDAFKKLKLKYENDFENILGTYNADTKNLYIYFYLKDFSARNEIVHNSFLNDISHSLKSSRVSRIEFKNQIAGYSSKDTPNNRYVVEMDPEGGWEKELFEWYDQEHLPGLASVSGCVRAIRCINLDNSPHSFAFYDLVATNVLGCEAWLKVRHTKWSDQVRPHFTNTKRTMFEFL